MRSHPANYSSDDPQWGVSAVVRLNGERPVIIQGSDDILQGTVRGAQIPKYRQIDSIVGVTRQAW